MTFGLPAGFTVAAAPQFLAEDRATLDALDEDWVTVASGENIDLRAAATSIASNLDAASWFKVRKVGSKLVYVDIYLQFDLAATWASTSQLRIYGATGPTQTLAEIFGGAREGSSYLLGLNSRINNTVYYYVYAMWLSDDYLQLMRGSTSDRASTVTKITPNIFGADPANFDFLSMRGLVKVA